MWSTHHVAKNKSDIETEITVSEIIQLIKEN